MRASTEDLRISSIFVCPIVLASLPWVSGCMEIVPLGIQMALKANGSPKSPNWNWFIWKLVDTSKIIRNAWWFILVYRMGDNQLSGRRFRRIQHPFSGHALDLDPLVLNLHILGSVFSLMTSPHIVPLVFFVPSCCWASHVLVETPKSWFLSLIVIYGP
jgi:hypothetical protein